MKINKVLIFTIIICMFFLCSHYLDTNMLHMRKIVINNVYLDGVVKEDTYKVYEKGSNRVIYGIPANTTIKSFLTNIVATGEFEVYDESGNKKSNTSTTVKIANGYTLKIITDAGEKTYKLSINNIYLLVSYTIAESASGNRIYNIATKKTVQYLLNNIVTDAVSKTILDEKGNEIVDTATIVIPGYKLKLVYSDGSIVYYGLFYEIGLSSYKINYNKKIIYNVGESTSASNLKNNIDINSKYELYVANEKFTTKTGNVKTGDTLLIKKASGTSVYAKYKLAVYDIDVGAYQFDNSKENIYGIAPNTNIETFMSNITTDGNLTILDSNNNIKTSGNIATGDKLKVTKNDGIEFVYTLNIFELTIDDYELNYNEMAIYGVENDITVSNFLAKFSKDDWQFAVHNLGDSKVTSGNVKNGFTLHATNTSIGTDPVKLVIFTYDINTSINRVFIDNAKRIIYQVPPKTKVNDFLQSISTKGKLSLSLLDSSGNVANSNSEIKTGNILRVRINKRNIDYTISVYGDATGSGNINKENIKKVSKRIVVNDETVDDAHKLAYDYDNSGKVKVNDALKMLCDINDSCNYKYKYIKEDGYPYKYWDNTSSLKIDKVDYYSVYTKRTSTYYIAHLVLSDPSRLSSALTGGGELLDSGDYKCKKISTAASEVGAIFAVEGDYSPSSSPAIKGGKIYPSFNDNTGVMNSMEAAEASTKKGTFYYNKHNGVLGPSTDLAEKDEKGNVIKNYTLGEVVEKQLAEATFSFGSAYLTNGKINRALNPTTTTRQRNTIGYVKPGEFYFLVSEGCGYSQSEEKCMNNNTGYYSDGTSYGIIAWEIAKILQDAGCADAYPLDGGGSIMVWFNGKTLNSRKLVKERDWLLDYIYFK